MTAGEAPVKYSFDEIYSRDAPALYRYLRRLTLSKGRAEDLLQETFLKLHLQLESGFAIENVRAWLFRVATHLAADRGKAETRMQLRQQEYQSTLSVVDFQSRLEQRHDVRRALARLSPRLRQLLLLNAEGFSYREMAEIAGVEPGYAGVLLQRARAEFRRFFSQDAEHRKGDRSSNVR